MRHLAAPSLGRRPRSPSSSSDELPECVVLDFAAVATRLEAAHMRQQPVVMITWQPSNALGALLGRSVSPIRRSLPPCPGPRAGPPQASGEGLELRALLRDEAECRCASLLESCNACDPVRASAIHVELGVVGEPQDKENVAPDCLATCTLDSVTDVQKRVRFLE